MPPSPQPDLLTRPTAAVLALQAAVEQFINNNHDPKTGRFAPNPGGSGTGAEIEVVDSATFQSNLDGMVGSDPAEIRRLDGAQLAAVQDQEFNEGNFTPEVAAAHSRYVGSGYGFINGELRGNPVSGTNEKDRARHRDQAERMKRGFNPPPARPLPADVVYRGAISDPVGPTLQPGQRFQDNGFVSTTHNPGIARRNFADGIGGPGDGESGSRTVYAIRPSASMRDRPVVAGTQGEGEWILPAGSTFTVGKITEWDNGNGRDRIIELEWDGVAG